VLASLTPEERMALMAVVADAGIRQRQHNPGKAANRGGSADGVGLQATPNAS